MNLENEYLYRNACDLASRDMFARLKEHRERNELFVGGYSFDELLSLMLEWMWEDPEWSEVLMLVKLGAKK